MGSMPEMLEQDQANVERGTLGSGDGWGGWWGFSEGTAFERHFEKHTERVKLGTVEKTGNPRSKCTEDRDRCSGLNFRRN